MNFFFDNPIGVEVDGSGQALVVGVDYDRGANELWALVIDDGGRLQVIRQDRLDMLWRYDYDKHKWAFVGEIESEETE